MTDQGESRPFPDPEKPAIEPQIIPPRKRRRARSPLRYLSRKGDQVQPLEFSQDVRDLVRDLATYGVPQDDIARHVMNPFTGGHISATTLRSNFRKELEEGRSAGNVKLSRSLFAQAVGAPAEHGILTDKDGNPVLKDGEVVKVVLRAEIKPTPGPTIFLAKNRLGMSDQPQPERTADDEVELVNALATLSEADLLRFRSILRRALTAGQVSGDGESTQTGRAISVRKKA